MGRYEHLWKYFLRRMLRTALFSQNLTHLEVFILVARTSGKESFMWRFLKWLSEESPTLLLHTFVPQSTVSSPGD